MLTKKANLYQYCYAASYSELSEKNQCNNHWGCYIDKKKLPEKSPEIIFGADPNKANLADWMFVMDVPLFNCSTTIPRERRILFLAEPPMIREYDTKYLEQFGVVVSPYKISDFSGYLMVENPRLGWFVGRGAGSEACKPIFNELSDVKDYIQPAKTKMASIVTSLKKSQVEYQRRILFFEALINHFGTRIDYYGRDFSPIYEKLDAIAPYKYHICVENSVVNNYWTEKLADAWIAWSLPIYCGAPNILEEIPDPQGIEIIDIDNIPASIKKIEKIFRDDFYHTRMDAIKCCRDWVIQEVNPFKKVAEIIRNASPSILRIPKLTEPYKIAPPKKRKKNLLKRVQEIITSHKGRIIATRAHDKYLKMNALQDDRVNG